MEPGSTLLRATAATAKTATYTFDADVPENEAFALVGKCSSGKITALGAIGPCRGGPGGMVALCAGGHYHVTVHVTAQQSRTWGIALYRTPACAAPPAVAE
jgi:hypothetical protein